MIAVVVSSINCQINSNKQSTNSSVPVESNGAAAAEVPLPADKNTGIGFSDSGIIKTEEKPTQNEEKSEPKPHTRKVTNTSIAFSPSLQEKKSLETNISNPSEPKTVIDSKDSNKSIDAVKNDTNDKSNSSNVPQPNQSKSKSNNTTTTNNNSTVTIKSTPKPITKTTTKIVPLPSDAKKPTITYSVEDVPGLLSKVIEQQKLNVPELPIAETIRENEYNNEKSSHIFMVPMIGMIVILPFLVIFTNCTVRRIRDYLSKRRYRRMDYLIEDMYN